MEQFLANIVDFWSGFLYWFAAFYFKLLFGLAAAFIGIVPVILAVTFYEEKLIPFAKKLLAFLAKARLLI